MRNKKCTASIIHNQAALQMQQKEKKKKKKKQQQEEQSKVACGEESEKFICIMAALMAAN